MSDRILGTWESSVGGFTYSTRYSAEDVTIEGHEAVSYSLEGDRLTIAGDAVMTRIVSFPEPDTMAQLDPVTGTVHLFQRAR
ncbi:MAG: hypothetical protein O3B72_02320 [Proteobacteria bacterium]|nr:hypothetical protein [Pseudomonadota bacterium]